MPPIAPFRASVLLIAGLLSFALPARAQQATGHLARHIGALHGTRTAFTPVTLCEQAPRSNATDALWSAACSRAEVLRYDRDAAQQLIAMDQHAIALTIPSAEGDLVLDLVPADVTTGEFMVRTASGAAIQPPPGAHYRGMVRGVPGSLASVSVFPGRMMALIADGDGQRVLGRPKQASDDLLVLYRTGDLLGTTSWSCATTGVPEHLPEQHARDGNTTTLKCVRMYWELAHDIFLDQGGTEEAAAFAIALFNQSATLFANDGVNVLLHELFVWDVPDVYSEIPGSSQTRLSEFQFRITTLNADLGMLLDLNRQLGGIAFIDRLCYPDHDFRLAYSGIDNNFQDLPTYSWNAYVVTHETGHLLGSPHTHNCFWNGNNTAIDGCEIPEGSCPQGPVPAGGTIMSYCDNIDFTLGFGPQPAQLIRDRVNAAACLLSCGGPACDTMHFALNTTEGEGTVLQLSIAGVPFPPASGQQIALCLRDGCYQGLLTDANGTPVQGTYTVTDANDAVIATGTTPDGAFSFGLGALVHGCTDPTVPNYDPAANCDDGSCCATHLALELTDSGGDGWEGAIYALVDLQGDTVSTGTLAEGASSTLHLCPPAACFTFTVTTGDDPGEIGWTLNGVMTAFGGAGETIPVNTGAATGCMDPTACNYDPTATCPGGCVAMSEWYPDADEDGFGAMGSQPVLACEPPPGYAPNAMDCDDTEQMVFPGMPEECDGIDNDCNGIIDDYHIWYADADGDGWGDEATAQIVCEPLPGMVQFSGDCDDADPSITGPGEPCDDGDPDTHSDFIRADCSCLGLQPGECPPGEIADCNGHCAPAGWVADGWCDNGYYEWNGFHIAFNCETFGNDGGDCDIPCPPEICDGIDNNCDGQVDEEYIWYTDADGDGLGDDATAHPNCAPSEGMVPWGGDCDDTDSGITGMGSPCDDGDDQTHRDEVRADCTCLGYPLDECPPGEVFDCNGHCAPADWIGDGWCDDGSAEWFDGPVFLNCAEHNSDGGDCGSCPIEICNGFDDDCDGLVDEDCQVILSVRVFLEGPYNPNHGLMHDGLRALGLVPLSEPYTGLGYAHVGGGGENTIPEIMAIPGGTAVVDWVVVELRDPADPSTIVATRSALLRRDGSVVDTDGTSPVQFLVPAASYHVAVRHRNHLGALTADPVDLSDDHTFLDLTTAATATHGTAARKAITGANPALVLWQGDVDRNERIKYTGGDNDRDPILQAIGGTVPTNTLSGYHAADVNMDGVVKYTGQGNDRDPILQNIGGTVPTTVKEGTVP